LLEGEQGSPFGESSTRYSGFDIRPMLEAGKEALRRGRKWLTPDQVQDGTFMLSGVAGLNQERPWGMQVGKTGELPVSGLVPKMAANIPKGEMEVYRAAGLEEWLKGKGKVSREELQGWMMENGPVVEVKELRPAVQGKTIYDKWRDKQAQLVHDAETSGVYTPSYDAPQINGIFIQLDEAGRPYGRNRTSSGVYETVDDVSQLPGLDKAVALLKHNATWTPELQDAHDKEVVSSTDSTIGKYQVEPRPVEEMEGPVELLVRVPKQRDVEYRGHDGTLWTGGHHGTSGHNTLGFGRANIEGLLQFFTDF